jgi:very-short-patch-repair endonuclease
MLKVIIGLTLAFFVIALLATIANKSNATRKGKDSPIHAKPPLSENEKPMYFRLAQAFPEHVVLAQVAFSALLKTQQRATRNKFDRKFADFVLCSKAFEVMAIIELDDASHNGKEKEDGARDKLMTAAGYRVLRYKRVPDVDVLLRDIRVQ